MDNENNFIYSWFYIFFFLVYNVYINSNYNGLEVYRGAEMKAINKATNFPFEVVEITEKAVKLKMKNGAFLVITKAEFMKNYRVEK